MRRWLSLLLGLGALLLLALPRPQPTHADSPAGPFNARLAINVGPDGRFNLGAAPNPLTGAYVPHVSWNLMYGWPLAPQTSFTTLRIDGADYSYGGPAGSWLQSPTMRDPLTSVGIWQIDGLQITQRLQIVANPQTGAADVAQMTYTIQNTGTSIHTIGTRVLIDTNINYNDGAPFRVPGAGIITHERSFSVGPILLTNPTISMPMCKS